MLYGEKKHRKKLVAEISLYSAMKSVSKVKR